VFKAFLNIIHLNFGLPYLVAISPTDLSRMLTVSTLTTARSAGNASTTVL
jgi:hypothetical protein